MIVSFSVALNIVSKCPGCSFFHAVLWYFAYKLVVCRDFGSHENNTAANCFDAVSCTILHYDVIFHYH